MQRPGVRDVMWICDIQWQTLNLKTKEYVAFIHAVTSAAILYLWQI